MTALFQLTKEYRATCDKLADLDLDPETLADTLDGERWPIELKAQNVGIVILGLSAQSDAIKNRITQLQVMQKAADKRVESLREYLEHNLTVCGIDKVEGPDIRLSWRASEAVEIEDESLIPCDLMTTPEPPKPKPDKAAIKAAIKAGRDVQGARIEKRRNLQIK